MLMGERITIVSIKHIDQQRSLQIRVTGHPRFDNVIGIFQIDLYMSMWAM